MKPLLSIVIPTHQHQFLYGTLSSIVNCQGFNDREYEIIVVENPERTEHTANVIGKINSAGHNIQHVVCQKLGANAARNFGINMAASDRIVLTDDDCYVDGKWLSAILSIYQVYPAVAIFGGSVIPYYDSSKPRWINGYFEQILACCNIGNEDIIDWTNLPETSGGAIVSANMSFPKRIWEELDGFDENIGYIGRNLIPGDEVIFAMRAAKIGKPGRLYVGPCIVHHHIPKERMSLEWLLKRSYGQGFALAKVYDVYNNNDKKVEDIVNDFAIGEWNHWSSFHSILDIRTKICHEESTRLYISNLLKCRVEFFRGFFDYFQHHSQRDSYSNYTKEPLFTLEIR